MTPSIIVRCLLRPSRLQDADLAGVAHHEAVGHRERLAVGDHAVAPDEAVGHARAQAADAAVLEDDGVFDLGVLDDDAVADGRVRPDEGVAEAAAGADHHRPAYRAAFDEAALADLYRALQRGLDDLAAQVALDGAEDEPVRLEHVFELAGVFPPAGDGVRLDAQAAVDHVLDGVGDLELAAGGGRDGFHALEDGRREEVHAHQREVAPRLAGLLDELHDAPVLQLGDAVLAGVLDTLEEYERVRRAALEVAHERRCLLYTSDAADDLLCVDLGGRR